MSRLRVPIVAFVFSIAVITVSNMVSDRAHALPRGPAATPPMGWNSWNAFGCDIHEQLIRETVDALVASGMAAAGYEYINLDDCGWPTSATPTATCSPIPRGFPVVSLGSQTTFTRAVSSSASTHPRERSRARAVPAASGYETRDAARFAEWGVDYLKYDNCGDHLGRTAIQRHTAMRDALLATGRPIMFSICNWGLEQVHTWGAKVGHLRRTTHDILGSWDRVMWILDQQVGLESYLGAGRLERSGHA